MKALVSGSAGFVGRHMAAELVRRGYDVTGVDVRPHGIAGATTICADFRAFLASPGAREGFDLVVHCAAVVGGRMMIDGHPLRLAAEDLSLDAELFRWLLSTPATPQAIYYSSSAAYPIDLQQRGTHHDLVETDIDLNTPALPDQTYGWVKLTGERLAAEANRVGIPVHVLRPFSGYGGDQDLDYPFPSFVRRALTDSETFEVWGDGTQERDFVHIDDVVGASLAVADSGVTAPVNIGTGRSTSFDELARMAMEAAGRVRPISHRLDKPVGVHRRVADPAALRWIYEPSVTVENGLARAVIAEIDA